MVQTMKKLRVASVQMEHTPGDKEANFAKIRDFVQHASQQGVEFISFPECCITGYWHLRHLSRQRLVELAEPVFDGPASQQLRSLAMDHKMTVAALPNGECQRHRKLHCIVSEHMSSGSEFTVFDSSP